MVTQNAKTPAKAGSGDKLKQKSLMSFFSKQNASANGATSSSKAMPSQPKVASSVVPATPQRQDAKAKDAPKRDSSVVGSSPSSYDAASVMETPPTSDAIDVDMLFADEVEVTTVKRVRFLTRIP